MTGFILIRQSLFTTILTQSFSRIYLIHFTVFTKFQRWNFAIVCSIIETISTKTSTLNRVFLFATLTLRQLTFINCYLSLQFAVLAYFIDCIRRDLFIAILTLLLPTRFYRITGSAILFTLHMKFNFTFFAFWIILLFLSLLFVDLFFSILWLRVTV